MKFLLLTTFIVIATSFLGGCATGSQEAKKDLKFYKKQLERNDLPVETRREYEEKLKEEFAKEKQ